MVKYRTAHLRAADGQSDMDAGRISVRVLPGGAEMATSATIAALRREGSDFSGMTLEWRGDDGRLHEQDLHA